MRTWDECDEKTFDPQRLYEYHMRVYRQMKPVYDAAMAARKGGAFYMAITLLREHGLHDFAELFVPLEMACLRRAYEEVEHE